MSPFAPLRENLERRERFRRNVLVSLGAKGSEIDTLLGYGCSRFTGREVPSLPLADEPFVLAWQDYAEETAERGVLPVLREKLVQLRFPIREGISREEGYRAATLRGNPPDPEQTALELADPKGLKLFLHETPAGTIPVLTVRDRSDFTALLCALSMRNESAPAPESMRAAMVSGLNNWDRIARHRRFWEATHPAEAAAGKWPAEFSLLIERKELYQDRLIILNEGGYSGVPAEMVGMTDKAWRKASIVIRLEHECVHYFTKRVFGSMKNAVHDEFIADYAGISAAAGSFRADWFLLFMGMEDFPNYRQGGRLQNYLGNPQPDAGVFTILKWQVKEAAENLERFETSVRAAKGAAPPRRTEMLLALADLHMEELASADAGRLIEEELMAVGPRRAMNLARIEKFA
jgi:hypothetical protein